MKLNSLTGLYYFHIAATHLSFKEAANTLSVTQAAISQQVRGLEGRLGTKLFLRSHRQVTLTRDGQMLHSHTMAGFTALEEGVSKLKVDSDPFTLKVSVLPSFASLWLVPRLGDFNKQHPEISVLLLPDNALTNFKTQDIDICVRYGVGQYQDVETVPLMGDHLYAACHPSYKKEKNIEQLSDLKSCLLLEDARPDMNWEYWLKQLKVEAALYPSALKYEGSNLVVEGAIASQGIALVRHSLTAKFINSGALVKLFNKHVSSNLIYCLAAPEQHFKRKKVRLFREWIQAQIADFQKQFP
ncbi:MAG: LysR family glycine cleavage system transcriptional activator [Oleiphilaceae bacterium]|jgi:LysR family glycine cleavage system transcriptional activator